MKFRCDLHAGNQCHSQSFFYAMHTFEDASRGNGNHHDSGSVSFTFDGSDFLSYGMTENQFLKAHAGAELEGSRTEATDGASGNLQHPGSLLVDTQLGMDWTFA